MARLPIPGQDNGAWGEILNEYLEQSLDSDGNLKSNIVSSAQIANTTISEAKLDAGVTAKLNATAPVTSVAGRTGVVTVTASDVGLGNVTNTSDANKPISTATQTALNLKASETYVDSAVSAITFPVTSVASKTGAVSLVKGDVGLGNVDNTSDANKPVSTAQQTAINNTISSGSIVGDDLVLTRVGGGQVTAGNVRGPKGDAGDMVPVATTTLSTTITISEALLPSLRHWTLAANTTVSIGTFTNALAGTITLEFIQPASGGPFTVTWPALSVLEWADGIAAPTMSSTAGARMVVQLLWDGVKLRAFYTGTFFNG